MGIVILRSMGGVHLDEEQMQGINLAEREEIRRIVDRSFRRKEDGRVAASLSARDSVRDVYAENIRAAGEEAEAGRAVSADPFGESP